MPGFGFGAGFRAGRSKGRALPAGSLTALGLAASTVIEGSAAATVIGGVIGKTAGSALSLTDTAGGRFALSGTNLTAGATATDFEAAATHQITIRETLAGAPNSPRDMVLNIMVQNVFEAPALSALGVSPGTGTVGTAATIAITGATAGSVITGAVPDGMALNSAARTISGTPTTAGTFNFPLTETLSDSANSPRVTNVSVTVAAASIFPLPAGTLWVQEGDSNTDDSFGTNNMHWIEFALTRTNGRLRMPAGGYPAEQGSTIRYTIGGTAEKPGSMWGRHAATMAMIDQQRTPGVKWIYCHLIGTNRDGDVPGAKATLDQIYADVRSRDGVVVAVPCFYQKDLSNVAYIDDLNAYVIARADAVITHSITASAGGDDTHLSPAQQITLGLAAETWILANVAAGAPSTQGAELYSGDIGGFASFTSTGMTGQKPATWTAVRMTGDATAVVSETTQGGEAAIRLTISAGTAGTNQFELRREIVGSFDQSAVIDAYADIAILASSEATIGFLGPVCEGIWPGPSNIGASIPVAEFAGPLSYRTLPVAMATAKASVTLAIRVILAAGQSADIVVSNPGLRIVDTLSGTAPVALTAPVAAARVDGQTPAHTAGTYSGSPTPTVSYTYYVDGEAVADSFVLTAGDLVYVAESASNANGSVSQQSATITVSAAGDVTAPTITSSAAANNAENSALAHALTANEAVTWSIRTAAQNAASVDHTHFELSGSTLRWTGNGTKNFEAPGDTGTNNTYVVVVRATDTAGNLADQTITITVTDVVEGSATTIFDDTVNYGPTGSPPFTAAQLQFSGDKTAVGATAAMAGTRYPRGLVSKTSGKWIFAVKTSSVVVPNRVGINNLAGTTALSAGTNGTQVAHYSASTFYYSNATNDGVAQINLAASMGATALGDRLIFVVNMDDKDMWVSRDGVNFYGPSATPRSTAYIEANPTIGANIGGLAGAVKPVVGLPNNATAGTNPATANAAQFVPSGITIAGYSEWPAA